MSDELDALLGDVQQRRGMPAPAMCRLLRESAGLSQDDIARVVGADRSSISRWERGRRKPSRRIASRYVAVIARLLNEASR